MRAYAHTRLGPALMRICLAFDLLATDNVYQGDFDLSKGETRESTTAYGVSFLEQVRRTADKRYVCELVNQIYHTDPILSGRLIASNFEELPSRGEDADYYKKTRMPISLSTIEKKLNNGEFKNLSEVEGYFKRMISNAKEYFARSTEQYDDAERIRKALSNFMTKTNPAYHVRGYQALPAPFPDSDGAEGDEDNEDEEDENNEEPEEDKEDENEDDEEDEEEEEEEEPSSRRRTITLKRRGPGRPPASTPRRASTRGRDAPKTPAPTTKPDHQYENVPYKGLSFQGAQEKIMEELIRREDPGYAEPLIALLGYY